MRLLDFLPFNYFLENEVRGTLELVREQWEDKQTHHPVSVHEYLSDFYIKQNDMAHLVGEGNRKAKLKYKEWYDKGTEDWRFEEGEYVLMLSPVRPLQARGSILGPISDRRKVDSSYT